MPKLSDTQYEYVERNLKLAQFLAHKYWPKVKKTVDLDETLQSAYEGLIDAAIKFDVTKVNPEDLTPSDKHPSGKAFSGYASIRIVGNILDLAHKYDRVPKRQRQLYNRIIPHRELPLEEVAAVVGLEVTQVQSILQQVEQSTLNLDELVNDEVGFLHDIIPDETRDIEQEVLLRQARQLTHSLFLSLPLDEQIILKLVIYDGLSVTATATKLRQSSSKTMMAYKSAAYTIYSGVLKLVGGLDANSGDT